jgi:hypothetical protein
MGGGGGGEEGERRMGECGDGVEGVIASWGSGERMDANAFMGRGCSVIAQAARGEGRERARERRERGGSVFLGGERERVTYAVTAYYYFIYDLFFSLEVWLLLPNLQCCCLAVP